MFHRLVKGIIRVKGTQIMLIYVSGLYTRGNVEENVVAAQKAAAQLWEKGHAVICPHANTHTLDKYMLTPISYDDWIRGDLMMIARCDAIVMLEKWEQSPGANIELEYAKSLGMPVYYYPRELPGLHPTEIHCPKQAKAFAEIVGKMYRTHLRKNADYSPANILATGEVGLVTRLWDKIARLLNLTGFRFSITDAGRFESSREPSNEAIEDTYEDAAVYSVIGLLLRKGVWGK